MLFSSAQVIRDKNQIGKYPLYLFLGGHKVSADREGAVGGISLVLVLSILVTFLLYVAFAIGHCIKLV